MIVAIHDGVVVGQTAAVVHRHPDKPTELYIDEVGVRPDYRRRGIARRMLELMLAHGKAIGCEEAWVGTEPDNLPARGLYDGSGRAAMPKAEPFVMYLYQLPSERIPARLSSACQLAGGGRTLACRAAHASSHSWPCISISREAVRSNSNASAPRPAGIERVRRRLGADDQPDAGRRACRSAG